MIAVFGSPSKKTTWDPGFLVDDVARSAIPGGSSGGGVVRVPRGKARCAEEFFKAKPVIVLPEKEDPPS